MGLSPAQGICILDRRYTRFTATEAACQWSRTHQSACWTLGALQRGLGVVAADCAGRLPLSPWPHAGWPLGGHRVRSIGRDACRCELGWLIVSDGRCAVRAIASKQYLSVQSVAMLRWSERESLMSGRLVAIILQLVPVSFGCMQIFSWLVAVVAKTC